MEDESAGQGISIRIEDGVSNDDVWEVLLNKIQNPDLFLPVVDVVKRVSDDGNGTYREMTTAFQVAHGMPSERRIIENIYADKDRLEVRFRHVDDENEVVNAILVDETGQRRLEYFLRNAASRERVHWAAPKKVGLGGIQSVLDKARK